MRRYDPNIKALAYGFLLYYRTKWCNLFLIFEEFCWKVNEKNSLVYALKLLKYLAKLLNPNYFVSREPKQDVCYLFLVQIQVMIPSTTMINIETPAATPAATTSDFPSPSEEFARISGVPSWGSSVVVSFLSVAPTVLVVVVVDAVVVVVVRGWVVVVRAAKWKSYLKWLAEVSRTQKVENWRIKTFHLNSRFSVTKHFTSNCVSALV